MSDDPQLPAPQDDAEDQAAPDLFDAETRIQSLPEAPGVYIMKNVQGKIIYIGKSINLKARVRSYFSGADPRPFVARLPKLLGAIDVILTGNEKEALLLENTLIKTHKPRYNIMLRDDKDYLTLRVDTRKPWPRVEIGRGIKRDGARYFGPYHAASHLRSTLNVLNKHFLLRTCPDHVLQNRSRPCLQYQIKRCPAPCVFEVDKEAYDQHVREALLFLEGRSDHLTERLSQRMSDAAEALDFELAAHLRDQIGAIQTSLEAQHAVSPNLLDQDILGLHHEGDRATLALIFIRRGRMEGSDTFHFKHQSFDAEELLSSFINQYYASGAPIPHEIVLPLTLEAHDALQDLLSEQRGARVTLHHPLRGRKHDLLQSALRNAQAAFEAHNPAAERQADQLDRLQTLLALPARPQRMECFDISNLQGDPIVGSMVVFTDGKPDKKAYRHFRVKSVPEQDDFASMYEVLTRRLKRSIDDDWPLPDLLVIDGGKGQLAQAVTVLQDLGLHDLPVVSLAKSRLTGDVQSPHLDRSPERVFLPGRKNPIILKHSSPELLMLAALRDEAHRFAITYHRKLRRQKTLHSTLDDIPHIGPARRKALLDHFHDVARIRDASLHDLQAVPGLSARLAAEIFAFFNGDPDALFSDADHEDA